MLVPQLCAVLSYKVVESEVHAIHDQAETIEWRTLLWKVAYRYELRNDVLDPNLTGREGYEA